MIMLAVLLTSCKMKCSVGGESEKTKTVSSSDNNALNGAIIKNDIDVEVTGVKLKSVYLVDEDNKLLTENKTRIGEKIYAVVVVDTGWVKEKGQSFLGASERISTPSGKVVVNADDIFEDYDLTGLPAKEAATITLSAVISQAEEGLDSFTVQFRVWDKKGKGEIKGKYKFSIVK